MAKTATVPLYGRIMGDSWARLAEPIRLLHATRADVRAHGRLRVDRGEHRMARLVASMLRLPRASAAAETQLTVRAHGDGERWERTIDGRRIDTEQYQSRQQDLAERYGVVELRFLLESRNGSLLYVQRAASFALGPVRVRIPDACAPRVEAREGPAGPRHVRVEVRVTLPVAGLLIAYHGTIELDERPA